MSAFIFTWIVTERPLFAIKQNADVLSHVTWAYLEVFWLDWQGVDKMPQYSKNRSIIIMPFQKISYETL
jgi:uncharacterized protein YcfL